MTKRRTNRPGWITRLMHEDVCYHEAGHALMMRFAKIGVKRIDVFNKPTKVRVHTGTMGVVHQSLSGCTTAYTMATRPTSVILSVLYAGIVAEEILRKRRWPKRGYNVGGLDREEIKRNIADFSPRRQRAIRRYSRKLTEHILRDGWPAVQNVARYLMRHGSIVGTKKLDELLEAPNERKTQKRRSTKRA